MHGLISLCGSTLGVSKKKKSTSALEKSIAFCVSAGLLLVIWYPPPLCPKNTKITEYCGSNSTVRQTQGFVARVLPVGSQLQGLPSP